MQIVGQPVTPNGFGNPSFSAQSVSSASVPELFVERFAEPGIRSGRSE